jgi:hypothetical protein
MENQIEEALPIPADLRPLEKIPDSALLKASRQEVGELTSYIHELEHEITLLKAKINESERLTSEDNKEFKKGRFYKDLQYTIEEQKKLIKELKFEKDRIFCINLKNNQKVPTVELDPSIKRQQIMCLDLETNSKHRVVSVDYDENIVIMESHKYGRTRNYIEKVKFYLED